MHDDSANNLSVRRAAVDARCPISRASGLLALLLGVVPTLTLAQGLGDLVVAPTRVVFEGRERSAVLTLINRGGETSTYRISFVDLRMEEDGRLVEAEETEAGQLPAARMIRYSPRQVTLEPGESQQVRLLLRRPADLAPGEYRSHLRFAAVPPAEEVGTAIEGSALAAGEVAVRLIPVFGVTIPVIVRHGELSAAVSLTELAVRNGDGEAPGEVAFHLERRGERSVYGDVILTWWPDGGSAGRRLGALNGIAVYTPNRRRTFRLPLHPPPELILARGTLVVTYAARAGGGILAEGRHRLP